jgi:hypothetical protein
LQLSLAKEGVNLSLFCHFCGRATGLRSNAKEGVSSSLFFFNIACSAQPCKRESANLSLFCDFLGQAWTTTPCK